MFDYLKGIISDKRKSVKGNYITIEVLGVGYLLEVTDSDFVQLNTSETVQKMYTSLIHREDAMLLYGFSTKETRDIFQILL